MLPSTYRDLPTFIVKPRLGPQPEGGGGVYFFQCRGDCRVAKVISEDVLGIHCCLGLSTLAGLIWNSGRVRYMNTDGFNRYLPGTYLGTQNSQLYQFAKDLT